MSAARPLPITLQGRVPRAMFVLSSIAAIMLSCIVATDSASAEETPGETSFTLAQVPDTQNEVLSDNPLLSSRYQWLVDNKQALNLKYIAQSGDYVNWGHVDPIQFTRARAATDILDADGIPYGLAIGNHDTAAVKEGGSAAPGNTHDLLRNTTMFNQTFPLANLKNVGGAFEANKVDNIYQTFTAGGVDWLVITHEMWPRQAVVDWMKQVTASHPNHNVIVNTHAYTNAQGVRPTTGIYGDLSSQAVWDQFLSQYPNIKIVLGGHFDGFNYSEATGVHGNKVAQILTCYHSSHQNHVRLLKIDTVNGSISSSVYVSHSTSSAYPTGYITDSASNFVTTGMNWLRPAATTPPEVPSAPGTVTATAGDASATARFTAPANNGGAPITGYTVTSSPGGITATGTTSPITVTGLTNATAYTFTVTATNAAGTSEPSVASNEVTPAPPTAPSSPTGVGAVAGNASATTNFTTPANNGGAPITGYTVTSSPGGITATGTTSPITVTGLTNATAYTFTVTATNTAGTSEPSVASNEVTPNLPPPTAPSPPTGISAQAGNASATVSFSAPTNNGGSPLTGYIVTGSPSGKTATGTSSPISISGLTNGTPYTFTVKAVNSVGASVPSAASASVTPLGELLPDPGFERGNGGWTPFVVGNISTVASPVHSGTKAIRVAASSTTVNLVGLTQNSVVTNSVAGKTYTARCYVRPTAAGLRLTLRSLEYTQNWSSSVNIGQINTPASGLPVNTWTLMQVSGRAVRSGERIVPQIFATTQTTLTGSVLYDDCSVSSN